MGLTVITGGGGDFGRAVGLEFGKKGPVLLTNRSVKKLEETQGIMQGLGMTCKAMHLDVSDRESCFRCAETANEYAKQLNTEISAVINIAGISGNYFPGSKSIDQFSINASGTVNITDAFYDVMARDAVMINFASMAAHNLPMFSEKFVEVYRTFHKESFAQRMMKLVQMIKPELPEDYTVFDEAQEKAAYGTAYCISKNFVMWYTQANTKRFAEKNMRVISISPGTHFTRHIREMSEETANRQMALNPLNRWGKPADMASACAFLCSTNANYITGCDILIDGGATHARLVEQIS